MSDVDHWVIQLDAPRFRTKGKTEVRHFTERKRQQLPIAKLLIYQRNMKQRFLTVLLYIFTCNGRKRHAQLGRYAYRLLWIINQSNCVFTSWSKSEMKAIVSPPVKVSLTFTLCCYHEVTKSHLSSKTNACMYHDTVPTKMVPSSNISQHRTRDFVCQ